MDPGTAGTEFGLVAGVDVGGTKTAVAIALDTGEVLARATLDTQSSPDARHLLTRAVATIRSLTFDAGHDADGLLGVGVVSPGSVQDDRIELAPGIAGLDGLSLNEVFREAFPAAVVSIDNDVKAATLAEIRWGSLRHSAIGLFINVGTGLAVGIAVNGQVFSGSHGAAGEIGYQQLDPDDPGFRSGHTPLEDVASGRVVSALVNTKGDNCAVEVTRAFRLIGMAVANACCLLDPDTVVVGGGLLRTGNELMGVIRCALAEAVPFPPTLAVATHTYDAALVGATALALDAITHARQSGSSQKRV